MVKSRTHANRGMELEKLIDRTNAKYEEEQVATILKIPTPFKKLGTKPDGMSFGFQEKGYLVDYIGLNNKGRMIIFDAKETAIKNLPLKNIHNHQYKLLSSCHYKGAASFLIVHFKEYNKYYIMPFTELERAYEYAEDNGKKSIPFKTFETNGVEIYKQGNHLDYLDYI